MMLNFSSKDFPRSDVITFLLEIPPRKIWATHFAACTSSIHSNAAGQLRLHKGVYTGYISNLFIFDDVIQEVVVKSDRGESRKSINAKVVTSAAIWSALDVTPPYSARGRPDDTAILESPAT